jgi:hypothetical protein
VSGALLQRVNEGRYIGVKAAVAASLRAELATLRRDALAEAAYEEDEP